MAQYEKCLLDHGYLRVVESWGSDEMIVETARMSTSKGFNGWGTTEAPGDEKLLRFLYENKHSTPFEFAGMTIEVQAPIMVFREWHRHRTQGYSERSARYAPLPDQNYVPPVERMLRASTANKQAGSLKGSDELNADTAREWRNDLGELYAHAEAVYQRGLALGVPKELARLSVPVGRYSAMRATANLRNWLGFATLRSATNAQEEIRVYSDALLEAVAICFPRTAEIFSSLRRGP
jgi:thymidylate synthase (FAD)